MLPKYLPAPYSNKLYAAIERKAKDGLNLADAFRFVNDRIGHLEVAENLPPLKALLRTYTEICVDPN